jgi:hypothetical protein
MKYLALFLAICIPFISAAQLTTTPNGGNKKASVSERVGLTDVTIHYDRPGVKGREGKIWGQLVHAGFIDQGFGISKSAPWRAGANENTTIEFSTAVKIEGMEIPAGKYGFFIAYNPSSCTLIFSRNYSSWGSYFYKESDDVLRVNVTPVQQANSVEWLKFEFISQTDAGATVALFWEKLMIPFKIETDLGKNQLDIFRKELVGEKSFNPGWQSWVQAAQYCLQNKTNLEEGLAWAEMAVNGVFIGEANFTTLSTKAGLLNELGRKTEADSAMKAALPMGKMTEVHGYARQLLVQKKTKEAFDAFKMNHDKYPGQFTTVMGMVRGYSGMGDLKKALEFAKKALPLAPDTNNKNSVSDMIKKLEQGKDIN